jgi:hypothetical protein
MMAGGAEAIMRTENIWAAFKTRVLGHQELGVL